MNQSEAVRIANIPTYTPTAQDFTPVLRAEGGQMQLREVQNLALSIAQESKGLLGLIGCGHGKTLISLLLPSVMQKKNLFYSYRQA